MAAYGRARFVLLCTVYILKLATHDNIVMASSISTISSPSGNYKLDLVVLLTKIEKECDVYSCLYINLIFIPVLS